MPAIDSITALGRLLSDGSLRDAYAAQPLQTIQDLDVLESERGALLDLDPHELEAQAQVLLRKRFEIVSRVLPQTCAQLGGRAWPLFVDHARCSRPTQKAAAIMDAEEFCRHLVAKEKLVVCQAEKNRIAFGSGTRKMAIHFVTGIFIRNRQRSGIQLFVRRSASTWWEHIVYLGLW